MVNLARRVLFLDGIGCNPAGFKPRFIAGLGYEVAAPALPDLDFPASVAIADRAMEEFRPDIIVGYSRGASVAMSLADRRLPRLLVAPALHWTPQGRGWEGRVLVLHSEFDYGLPLEEVQEFLVRCGVSAAELRIVGEDHAMIDAAALTALREALAELSN